MIPANLAPLKVHARCVADFPTIREHVKYCCGLGLKYLVPTAKRHDLEAVLVGSGPSVKEEVNSLKTKRKDTKYVFFGIKGGHDFLLENGIEPDFGLAVDPLEKIHKENFLRDAVACKYFIASQCHPSLFDNLLKRGKEVVIWHLMTDNLMKWALEEGSPIYKHYMIPGGSTSGLRALVLSYAMGFRKFHLYGYDSCLTGKQRKVVGSHGGAGEIYDKKDAEGKDKVVTLHVLGKTYLADPAMASQANEFQEILKTMWRPEDPFKVRGYGKGLIQALIRERYRQGAQECVP